MVTIEIPRWSFVKYCQKHAPSMGGESSFPEAVNSSSPGYIDFISPFPCPYNYGFVAETAADDGMELDAIVCGPRLKRAARVKRPVRAVIYFTDAGRTDDKLVCHDRPLSARHYWFLRVSFHVYVAMKRLLNWWRGKPGETRYHGIQRV